MARDYVSLSINGKLVQARGKDAFLPLSDFLRYEQSLTGTKVVCAEGDCGACTVMMRRPGSSAEMFSSLNSCISASLLLDGCHIVTVEGLCSKESLSEVQSSMVRNFGGQCGFCTPGFVMSLSNLYEQKKEPTEQNIKNYLTGNLCRCTGYQPIIRAAQDVDVKKVKPISALFNFQSLEKVMSDDLKESILITWDEKEFFAPSTLEEAVSYRMKHPECRIFSGATDLGVQINKGKNVGKHLMSLHLIKELNQIVKKEGLILVGARVNLNELQNFIADEEPEFSEFLNIFASPQIKNAATLIGNVANGSPIADTTPFLLAADAEVVVFGKNGQRKVDLNQFILGYKKFDLHPDELITHIQFKSSKTKSEKTGLYKISKRRDLDISCVNSCFRFQLENGKILKARIVYGGVGPRTLRLSEIEDSIVNKQLNRDLVNQTKKMIANKITPISDARGSQEFRAKVSQDLFESFIMEHYPC